MLNWIGIDQLMKMRETSRVMDKKPWDNNNLQGKSFLTAIFCCVRAILFPESKIILAAGNKSQSIEVIEKILDLKNNSPNLAREIEDIKTGSNDARVVFRNGSWIRCVASNQGARSKRANIVVVD